MITPNFQRILTSLNDFLNKDFAELNSDLLCMLNYTIMHYSRNVFNYEANWKKVFKKYDFDYDYVNETGSSNDIIQIEKDFRKYARFFKNMKDIKNSKYLTEYKKFISDTMDIMVNKIIIPIEEIMQRFYPIIEKYRSVYKKKEKRSSKINYAALEKLMNQSVSV